MELSPRHSPPGFPLISAHLLCPDTGGRCGMPGRREQQKQPFYFYFYSNCIKITFLYIWPACTLVWVPERRHQGLSRCTTQTPELLAASVSFCWAQKGLPPAPGP